MQTRIKIKGTHCPACKALIEDICQDNTEIESCVVNYETGEVNLMHTSDIDWKALKNEIEESGDYEVILDNN